MAKRAKTDGSAFNPVADSLVRAVTSPQPRIVTGYQDESEDGRLCEVSRCGHA